MANGNTYSFAQGERNRFREAVAVSVPRVFDCCSDRECLEDLQLLFTPQDQAIIQASGSVKGIGCEVTDVTFSVQDFKVGDNDYAVDCVFYMDVALQCYPLAGGGPLTVTGHATHQKRTLLHGGEGGVRTFTSAGRVNPHNSGPEAAAQVSEPVLLSVRLTETPPYALALNQTNDDVARRCADLCLDPPSAGGKTVLCSVGLFSVISLEGTVQLLMPAYDYAVPEKDCSRPAEDPCEVFRQMRFPTGKFFPDQCRGMRPGNR